MDDLIEIAKMAALIFERKNWHKLSDNERDFVKHLEDAGFIEKSTCGFVGKAVSLD